MIRAEPRKFPTFRRVAKWLAIILLSACYGLLVNIPVVIFCASLGTGPGNTCGTLDQGTFALIPLVTFAPLVFALAALRSERVLGAVSIVVALDGNIALLVFGGWVFVGPSAFQLFVEPQAYPLLSAVVLTAIWLLISRRPRTRTVP
jgi:hypothetical protein